MSEADIRLLREMLRDAYRDVNPEISDRGAHLVRKLADGLYARGGRVVIGTTGPPRYEYIYQSCNPLGHLVWTCKDWNRVMGYRNHAAIGRHYSEFVTEATYQHAKDFVWPELVRTGKVENVPVTYVRSTGELLVGLAKSDILRDSTGAFERTFAKIRITLTEAAARVINAAGLVLLSVAA